MKIFVKHLLLPIRLYNCEWLTIDSIQRIKQGFNLYSAIVRPTDNDSDVKLVFN